MRCLSDNIINKNSAHNDIKMTRFSQITSLINSQHGARFGWASITWLESLKESVRGKFVYGDRIRTPLARHRKTAFESRILMSAMINFKHIEPRRFLKDVSKIVLEHVHCVMQRYDYKNEHCFQWRGMFVWIRVSPNKSIAIWKTLKSFSAQICASGTCRVSSSLS